MVLVLHIRAAAKQEEMDHGGVPGGLAESSKRRKKRWKLWKKEKQEAADGSLSSPLPVPARHHWFMLYVRAKQRLGMATQAGCRAELFQGAGAVAELAQPSLAAWKDAVLPCTLFCAKCC